MTSPSEPIYAGTTISAAPGVSVRDEPFGSARADFLSAVIETQNDITAVEFDPRTVMRLIVERAQQLTGADGSLIDIIEGGETFCPAATGVVAGNQGTRYPGHLGTTRLALAGGEAHFAADTETDPNVNRERCRRAGVRSLVAVPLIQSGKPVGVLKVVSRSPGAFVPRDVSVVRLMAALLAAALSHATEFEAKKQLLAERTEGLAALRGINQCLRESEERFRGAFEHAPIGMALVSLDGRWRRVNASLCRIIGYGEEELLATTFQAITHPEDLGADLAMVRELVAAEIPSYRLTKRYFHRDGHVVWAELSVSLVRGDDGRPLYFISQIQDVSPARRQSMFECDQRAVLETVARDRPLLDALNQVAAMVERQLEESWAAVLLLDEGEIHPVAPNLPRELVQAMRPHIYGMVAGLSQLLSEVEPGESEKAPRQMHVSDLARDPVWQGVAAGAGRAATGHGVRACWAAPIRSGDDTPLGLLVAFCRHDRPPSAADGLMLEAAARLATLAVEHHQTTRRLAHLVRHDPLTGMPNRLCFEDRLQQATALARRSGRKVALFVADVDHFKQVNDTLGHDAGDSLLQQFSQRLRAQLRETDTLARMGGDEFIILLPELPCRADARAVAEKLHQCLAEPFEVGGRELPVTSSMGIAIYPDDGDDSATLQRRADEQLYVAKRSGRNCFSITAEEGDRQSAALTAP